MTATRLSRSHGAGGDDTSAQGADVGALKALVLARGLRAARGRARERGAAAGLAGIDARSASPSAHTARHTTAPTRAPSTARNRA